MKGFKTIATGAAIAIGPVALQYFCHIDWTQFLDPKLALAVSGVLTIALRIVTNTPVGKTA